ncbi:MAG: hypothetical protein ACLT40_10515 [Fusobacterium sp.]
MRTEQIKSNNTEHIITITKDNADVKIEFDFELTVGTNPEFTIPLWAVPIEESYEFTAGLKLNGELAEQTVEYRILAQIRDFLTLSFVPSRSERYTGTLNYLGEAPKDSGIILNGIRLNCIASIGTENFFVMLSVKRNHEGNLITSTTMDAQKKRRFNITTIPLADEEYLVGRDTYCNTIEEFEKLLFTNIGNYKTFTYRNKDYTVVLSDEVSEINQQAFVNGKLADTTIYTFTLEEV